MCWFVYILRCSDNSLYTGITKDVKRRLKEHKTEKNGAKYTKSKKAIEVVFIEKSKTRSEAAKREFAIKKLKKTEKEKLILNNYYSVIK